MPLVVDEPDADDGDAYIGVLAIAPLDSSGPRAPRELARYFLPRPSENVEMPEGAHWPKTIRWNTTRRDAAALGLRAVAQTWSSWHSQTHEPISLVEVTFCDCSGWFIHVPSLLTRLLERGVSEDAGAQDYAWHEWGPHNTTMMQDVSLHHREANKLGVCGFHIALTDRIIGFNKYDNKNDIYPWAAANEHSMRRSTLDQRPRRRRVHSNLNGIWTTVHNSDGSPLVGRHFEVMTAHMPFSTTPIRLKLSTPNNRSNPLALIEEQDGPKVHIFCDICQYCLTKVVPQIIQFVAETAALQYFLL